MPMPTLSDLQRRIVWRIEEGDTQDEIAEYLGVHVDTLREHERKLKRRYNAENRLDLPGAVRASGQSLDAVLPAA